MAKRIAPYSFAFDATRALNNLSWFEFDQSGALKRSRSHGDGELGSPMTRGDTMPGRPRRTTSRSA
jgi:hypothetical protein